MDIYLRALEPSDYLITHEWRQQESDWDLLIGLKRFVSKETERNWVEHAIKMHEKNEVLRFVICNSENGSMIGLISAVDIDLINKSFGISSLVGDKECRGKGVIGNARKKVMRYMFEELGMNKATSRILETNQSSRKAVEKFGFKEEGKLREAVYKSGSFQNVILYAMLKSEFYNKYAKD